MDELRQRMLMQLLLQGGPGVEEGKADPTAPGYMGPGGNHSTYPIGGIQPDRSGDPGMTLKPSGGPHRMAPRDQASSVNRISAEAPTIAPGAEERADHTRLFRLLDLLKGR